MSTTRRALIGSSLAGVSVALTSVRPARAAGKVLRIALGTTLNTLDPMMTTIGDEYVYDVLVFNGLTRMREDLVIEPDLAESWSFSADLKRWTFKLRQGVKFHDGSVSRGGGRGRVVPADARSGEQCAGAEPV